MNLWSVTERFIQERQILNNVSPATIDWYRYSLQAFQPVLEAEFEATGTFKAAVIQRIGELQTQGRGNKAVSVNTYLRCLKAFMAWAHQEQIVKEPFKLAWLREENKILATFTTSHIKALVDWKPVRRSDCRLQTLTLTALDTGMRVEELVSLSRTDVDFQNFTFLVKGKGNKQRLVPMSIELRKLIYRHLAKHEHVLVFATFKGGKLSKRNLLRDFKEMCGAVKITGVRCSLHTARHTFSVNYLRNGGNLYYLQRILGHNSITTTEKYVRSLGIEDIVKEHSSRSVLSIKV
jgi:site-specific recombinase XerD